MMIGEFPSYESLEGEDDEPPPAKRPIWLGDALLPKTSPVVPWDNATVVELTRLKGIITETRKDAINSNKIMLRLQEEMEAAWRAK